MGALGKTFDNKKNRRENGKQMEMTEFSQKFG
jgi:hypothetical protein